MIGSAPNRASLWLVGLLVFHLLLLSVQVRGGDGRLLIRSIGLTLLSPLASSLQFVTTSAEEFIDHYASLRNAQEENRRLQEENRKLRLDLYRLRDLVALLPHSADYQALMEGRRFEVALADVIFKSDPFLETHIVINAGSRRGVETGGAVITPDGIVGRVVSVGPFTAEVELVTNDLAAAGARLENSRAEGVVKGTGKPHLLLDYIPISQPVAPGELVVTSGTDRIYPRGIPIGHVESVRRESPIYQTIHVKPAVEPTMLDQVLVLTAPTDDADQLAAGPGLKDPEAQRQ